MPPFTSRGGGHNYENDCISGPLKVFHYVSGSLGIYHCLSVLPLARLADDAEKNEDSIDGIVGGDDDGTMC